MEADTAIALLAFRLLTPPRIVISSFRKLPAGRDAGPSDGAPPRAGTAWSRNVRPEFQKPRPFTKKAEKVVMKVRNSESKARVLIVDDHPAVRRGVHCLVETEPDIDICGESEGGVDALKKVVTLQPDVATMDLNLGAESGLDLIQLMRALRPALRIIVLSTHGERSYRERAAVAGATAFVTKSEATQRLVPAIRNVMLHKPLPTASREIVQSEPFSPTKAPKRSQMQSTMSVLRTAAAVLVACGISLTHAATLTSVPMQGGMAMPMISYHADHGHLHVMMPTEVPQLTPLLVSNPNDNFDPADPWYDFLDPTRQGLSFSRRYGFVMDAMSDPLPANVAIWLRKLSGPSELGFYRYSGSAPKAWEPIFGTAGTTNALHWNGMMFHPGVTAPANTNSLTATFEAYLVDTTTGQQIPGSSTDPMVLAFTNISDGRPALSLAQKIVVAWPATATNWVLEAADSLPSSNWTQITNAPVIVDGQPAVIFDGVPARKFFRMRRSP